MGELARAALASMVRKLKTVKVGHRITDSAFAARVCGEGVAIAELRYGARAIVFVNDYIGRTMYLWGEYDPRITGAVEAVLQPGDTVLDIGANFGVVGLFACRQVGDHGTVHMFEPQPIVAQCLRTSALINRYHQAVVHECALSNRSGAAEMTIADASNLGMTALNSNGKQPAGAKIQVRVENAGDYIRSLNCRQVSMVKIDVEGHEGVILDSMSEWMREVKPGVVLFECKVGSGGFWSEHAVTSLAGMGYEFFGYDSRPYWSTRLRQVTRNIQRPWGIDYLAIRPDNLRDDVARRIRKMTSSPA
jgi:FkbM family methyltransferase